MFHGNRTMRRLVVARTEPEQLREPVAEFFFSSTPPEPEAETELGRLRIAWTWLERNRNAANTFDVELTGGLEDTLRILTSYLAETPDQGKVIHI